MNRVCPLNVLGIFETVVYEQGRYEVSSVPSQFFKGANVNSSTHKLWPFTEIEACRKDVRHEESGAVDYRRYPFFKILYSDSDAASVSMKRGKLVLVTLAFMIAGCVASVPLSVTLEQQLDNLKGALLDLMVFLFAYNELTSRARMQRLIEYIERCTSHPRYDLTEEKEIMAKAKKNAAYCVKFYTILFALNFPMMMVTKPIEQTIGGKSWKQLPFPWAILPSDGDIVFSLALLLHAFGIGFSHCLGITVMCHITAITGQISALFDVVVLGIDKIEERAAKKVEKLGLKWEQSMDICIKESVGHHQELLRELEIEKPCMEFIYFAQTLCMSLIIACEAFPLILDNLTLFVAAKGLVFLVVQILCVYICNNAMEMMGDRNTKIFDAIYNSKWYECSAQYRKVVLNGMTFSRQPLLIAASGFRGLKASRETFYNAMISSFNILSMMRRMV